MRTLNIVKDGDDEIPSDEFFEKLRNRTFEEQSERLKSGKTVILESVFDDLELEETEVIRDKKS